MAPQNTRIAEQAKAVEDGKKVYCDPCLKEQFKLSTGDIGKLVSADPGDCSICGGPGPLFFR